MSDEEIARLRAFRVGPLAVTPINRALGTKLDSADVWVSKACHMHIALDHPGDYDLIISNIVDIIRNPTWVGQDPKHGENFYLVKSIPTDDGRELALIAIGLTLSAHGTYSVRSGYSIDQTDLDSRRAKGSVKMLLP